MRSGGPLHPMCAAIRKASPAPTVNNRLALILAAAAQYSRRRVGQKFLRVFIMLGPCGGAETSRSGHSIWMSISL